MNKLQLMNPPKENLVQATFDLINFVSDYKNGSNSIGYSYYYYANTMFQTIDNQIANNIKLLGVNGVKPNNQTIHDSTYPFRTAYYIVINKADEKDSPARILANHMLSPRGQKIAADAGYIPVK